MELFLRRAVCFLVGEDAEFGVTSSGNDGKTSYLITVPHSLKGRLIGKGGATVHALRTLVGAASGDGEKISIEIED